MMGKPGTTYVIEIATGIGEPASIPLFRGQKLSPISVGKKGMWRVESARTLDVHAFLYFDGDALFVQSADEAEPAMVDGKRIGKAWTEMRVSCTIELGSVRLRYRALAGVAGDANAAVPMPPPAPSAPTAQPTPKQPEKAEKPKQPETRPFARGAFAPMTDFEATRVAPLEAESREQKSPAQRVGSPRPAAGRPAFEAYEDRADLQATPRPAAGRPAFEAYEGRAKSQAAHPQAAHQVDAHLHPTDEQESTVILSPLANMPTRIAPPLPVIHPQLAPVVPMGAVPTAPPVMQAGFPGNNYPGNYPQAPQSPQSPYAPNPEYPYSPNARAFAETRLGTLPPINASSGASGTGSMGGGPSMPYPGADPPEVQSPTASTPGSSPTGLGAKWKAWRATANATPPKTADTANASGGATGWKAQIPSPRVLLLFLLVMALGVYGLIDDYNPSPKPTPAQPVPSASTPEIPPDASVMDAGAPDASVMDAGALDVSIMDAGAPDGQRSPLPPARDAGVAPGVPVGDRDAGAPADAGVADGGKGKGIDPTTPTLPTKKTLERKAVDAYAAGDFALAAQCYTELAKGDPSNPAYEQAARIARMRMDAGPNPGK